MPKPWSVRVPVAVALLGATLPALAQDTAPATQPATPATTPAEPAAELPAATDILAAYVEAIGGEDAIRANTHRKLTGTYRGAPFGSGARITLWQVAPNKSHLRLAEPLGMTLEFVYDGETAWEKLGNGQAQELGGSRLIETIETADFYGESNYAQRYAEMETMDSATIGTGEDTQTAWVVRVVSHQGRERLLFFGQDSKLFIAEQSDLGDGSGRAVRVVLDDYQEVGGVLFPMRQRQEVVGAPSLRAELRYREGSVETFEHDFSPPADLLPVPPEASENADSEG